LRWSIGWIDEIAMEDGRRDLALVRCVFRTIPKPITTLRIDEGPEPPIGETVYAIGSPKGLEGSLSPGIISGKREVAPGVSCLRQPRQ